MKTPEQELDDLGGEPPEGSDFENEEPVQKRLYSTADWKHAARRAFFV